MNSDPPDLIDEVDPADCFLRILPELRALPPHKVRRVSESVIRVVPLALGTLPHLRALRPRINALPEFDATLCDRLQDYAFGLRHADSVWLSTLPLRDQLPDLLKEGGSLKLRLLRDAEALAQRGLLDASRLKNLAGYHGYKEVASDLRRLRIVLKECGVEHDELEYAEKLALRMDRLRGQRVNPPTTPRDEARDLRARAFTVLIEAYGEIEHAVGFLLRNDPQRAVAFPPLYRGRPRKSRSKAAEKNLGVV